MGSYVWRYGKGWPEVFIARDTGSEILKTMEQAILQVSSKRNIGQPSNRARLK
jgi:hypothetical protein